MNQLEKYREELMACNEKILEGLLQRNAVVEELMAYKEENKMPMLQPEQEERQRSWLEKQMEGHRHKQQPRNRLHALRCHCLGPWQGGHSDYQRLRM